MPDRLNLLDLMRRLSTDLKLRAGEFDAIFDVLPIGIGIAADPGCRDVRVNRAFTELAAEPTPAVRLPMQQAARDGAQVGPVDVEIHHPDGRRLTLYEYALPLYDDDGQVTGAIAVVVDISERRRIEQEQRFLAEASRVLTSSLDYDQTLKALSELAVPTLGDYCAIDVAEDDGRFSRVAFVAVDPARRETAAGLRRYPPALSRQSPAARAIRTGEPALYNDCPPDLLERSAQNPEHLDLLRRFGACAFMMLPLRARGRTLGLMTVGATSARRYGEGELRLAADVAGRAALALDNALLYRQAQDSNRIKEDFLATLSHELRTPLNALLGWTHLLKAPATDENARRRALDSIERNAHAQAVLINDLLDVSRVITGKLRLDVQPLDVAAVVLSAVDSVRPAVRAREIDLVLSIGPIAGQVIGDPDRLQQVVWNLLSNAVKFTPRSGRVDLSVEESTGAVQIVVRDTGIGIDPAFLPHVFERFRQADSSTTRAHAGLGLGLAIVRHLVDLHGGTVTVTSEGVGLGSTFTVTLPTRIAPATAAAPREGVAPSPPLLTGVRVLAVDDDEDARELVLLTVRGAGAEVMVVGSGASALDAVETFAPHVLVTDIAMPGMDGYSLVRELRARLGERAPAAIALSAYLAAGDLALSRDAGFVSHLGKPVDYDTLLAAIAEAVGQQQPSGNGTPKGVPHERG